MAKSKPRTQPTGILDIVKDIVSPWLGTPPAQNRSVTQAQGLARSAAETLDQTFAGGMVKAGVQGNKALVKQAAVNVAALGTGYIAGKAAVTAASAVAKTGVTNLLKTKTPTLKWDSKPYRDIPAPNRANFYWKPDPYVVNPKNPDISYTVAVRPANPQSTFYAPRSVDAGYKIEVNRYDEKNVNKLFDSAQEYNQIIQNKYSSSNAPTSSQLIENLSTSQKTYKKFIKAQLAAEKLIKKDIKRR